MKKENFYVHYDKDTGEVLGVYHPDVHEQIPLPWVEVTPEEWQKMLNEGSNTVIPEKKRFFYTEPTRSVEELMRISEGRVKSHLNAVARERGYDNITTAVSYADEPSVPEYQREGRQFRAWRSLVWKRYYELRVEWEQTAKIPENFIELLPLFGE